LRCGLSYSSPGPRAEIWNGHVSQPRYSCACLRSRPPGPSWFRHPSNVGSKIQCRDMNLKHEYRFVKGDRPRPSALFGGENIPTSVLKKRSGRLLGLLGHAFDQRYAATRGQSLSSGLRADNARGGGGGGEGTVW
jgi:hypothetical protein